MGAKLTKKFWAALLIFSLMGQVAWVVENMYFNVFIYKMFHASAADISRMVAVSSVVATVTTILVGAYTDYVGKRKRFICGGYIAWGISILAFAWIRMDLLTPLVADAVAAATLGITLVIVMDCVMTFLGSSANDACFNAWMTDWGQDGNRGKIEGFNSMMPLVAILVVFGGFAAFDLEQADSWSKIFWIVGIAVVLIGVLGMVLIEEKPGTIPLHQSYWKNLSYSFRPSVCRKYPLLYAVIGAFAIFGISINIFMPYLILYYEKSLGMDNYVFIMAPAIVLAAVFTAAYGKLFDLIGFQMSVIPAIILLMLGYVFLFFGRGTAVVFVGSLLMMCGYLSGMAIFGAMIRNNIPEHRAGQFQGIRIIGQVLIPGILGPSIGAWILRDAEMIVNSDGTTSFLPNEQIYLGAFVVAAVLLIVLSRIFVMMRDGIYPMMSACGEEYLKNKGKQEVWKQYPRPQMCRDSYLSLNGEWMLNNQAIQVPFPPQSKLSGYQGKVGTHLEYTKEFTLNDLKKERETDRLLLHFGAVDQIAEVFVNDKLVGRHEGGYLAFTFDITDVIHEQGTNVLRVKVEDKLSNDYPYGKQTKKRGGMWYTPVSGIWQSVWMERVPASYIQSVKITTDMQTVSLQVSAVQSGDAQKTPRIGVDIMLHHGELYSVTGEYSGLMLDLTKIITKDGTPYQPRLWTLDDPYLYQIKITMGEDQVTSYFALRQMQVQEVEGLPRVCLNGEPIFLHGVLDQGYFCDGIYLPAQEEEYERDILRMKELGYNLLRKHIKVEPECFYYYCDVHGMLVMQDMVNNGGYSWLRDTALPTLGVYLHRDGKWMVTKRQKEIFIQHMKDTMEQLHNHPCIVSYTIFNEGWGQFSSDEVYQLAKKLDPTRIYDATSGWFPRNQSDFNSQHVYFTQLQIPEKPTVPLLISECGGYSYPVVSHTFAKYASYGYGACKDSEELTERIREMYERLVYPAIEKGLCGCIYTQVSDVEDEINGFYTYDRRICKVEKSVMQEIARTIQELHGKTNIH